ncbi:MAG: hypothetical protein AAGD06_21995 [Acidobacteriota bacterium]
MRRPHPRGDRGGRPDLRVLRRRGPVGDELGAFEPPAFTSMVGLWWADRLVRPTSAARRGSG